MKVLIEKLQQIYVLCYHTAGGWKYETRPTS